MKVKINGKYHDSGNEPIMIVFNSNEKYVSHMDNKAFKYFYYPQSFDKRKIREYMEIDQDNDDLEYDDTNFNSCKCGGKC